VKASALCARERELAGPRSYSLYTTGSRFDIERKYGSPRQAEASQAMLDRLEALNGLALAFLRSLA